MPVPHRRALAPDSLVDSTQAANKSSGRLRPQRLPVPVAVAGVVRGPRGEECLRGEIAEVRLWGLERCFGEPRFGGRGDGERAGAGVLVLGAAEELVPLGVTLVTIFSTLCIYTYTLYMYYTFCYPP